MLNSQDRGGQPDYLGKLPCKPRFYRVTILIPHLETIECLPVCIELLQKQTIRPYIVVVDTGSTPPTCAKLEEMRTENVEIHYIKSHGWSHGSEPVTAALDLGLSLCQTPYLFCTHVDVFPMRQDLLEFMLTQCSSTVPVVGYEISPRGSNEWEGCFGHVCTIFHVDTLHSIGATWAMRRVFVETPGLQGTCGWPDTETALNRVIKRAGLKTKIIGKDNNDSRFINRDFDHVRSYTVRKIHGGNFEQSATLLQDALQRAQARVLEWNKPQLNPGTIDVTSIIKSKVENGYLTIIADNRLAGDPAVGVVKVLRIVYSVGSENFVTYAAENQILKIASRAVIQRATYGLDDRRC